MSLVLGLLDYRFILVTMQTCSMSARFNLHHISEYDWYHKSFTLFSTLPLYPLFQEIVQTGIIACWFLHALLLCVFDSAEVNCKSSWSGSARLNRTLFDVLSQIPKTQLEVSSEKQWFSNCNTKACCKRLKWAELDFQSDLNTDKPLRNLFVWAQSVFKSNR